MMENLSTRTPLPREKDGAMLRFLYNSVPGRVLLRALSSRGISKLCGSFMSSPLSRCIIKSFIKGNHIDLEQYEKEDYRCFNDCFCRRIKRELRPIDESPTALIAPCDGLLSAYPIRKGMVIPAKHSRYSISALLGSDPIASRFEGGTCLVFRLCVHHYHRYIYLDAGRELKRSFLPGVLHTVRPIALERLPVFVRNCREYALLETKHLGLVAQIEIGAMLVGKIKNHAAPAQFERGMEKGMFLYGGSTVVLLLEPGRVSIPEALFKLTENEQELPVQMGECIARINLQ